MFETLKQEQLEEPIEGENNRQEPEKKYPVIRRCCRCKKIMGVAYYSEKEEEFTDGYCPICLEKELKNIKPHKNSPENQN